VLWYIAFALEFGVIFMVLGLMLGCGLAMKFAIAVRFTPSYSYRQTSNTSQRDLGFLQSSCWERFYFLIFLIYRL
jgi:hypothetical protein